MAEMHKTSRGFLGAYRKGRSAAIAKQPRQSPYPDHRGGCFAHVVTWSRSFRNYWLEGYDDEKAGTPEHYTATGAKQPGNRV